MAETTKKKRFKHSTFFLKGMAKYAWLDKPDPYQMDKGKEQYKLRMLLDDDDTMREQIALIMSTGIKEAKLASVKLKKVVANPFKFPEDMDEDDYVVQEGYEKPKLDEDHKDRIWVEVKTSFKPAMIGTAKNEKGEYEALPDNVKIMSGDIVRIKVMVNPYEGFGGGISLRLVTAQLVKKSSNFTQGADTRGFDDFDDEDQSDEEDETDDDIPF